MGWAGRAPAPPAREAGKGRQTPGPRHGSQGQFSNSRDRHRYRQELISRGWSGQARRDHASAEVVARTGGSTAGQLAALSNRHGGLRRCASSESQAANAWTRRSAYAGEYVRPYSKGQKNDFRDAEAIAEAVQRPTMKFVATKSTEQLDLQALHRVRERLVSQRTGI